MLTKPRIYSGGVTRVLTLTLQQLGVDEQLQRQQQPHQEDAGHQETVEPGRQQADLPQRRPLPAAGFQPVGPDEGGQARRDIGRGG